MAEGRAHLFKFNPYHDKAGRFASRDNSASGSAVAEETLSGLKKQGVFFSTATASRATGEALVPGGKEHFGKIVSQLKALGWEDTEVRGPYPSVSFRRSDHPGMIQVQFRPDGTRGVEGDRTTLQLVGRGWKLNTPNWGTGELSGSLGIERKNMPQIRTQDHADFLAFLNTKGVSVSREKERVGNLLPTQKHFNPEQARQMTPEALTYPLMVSSDNRVLDGTNRWARLLRDDPAREVEVVRIAAPAKKALELMGSFPRVGRKDVSEIGVSKMAKGSGSGFLQLFKANPYHDEKGRFTSKGKHSQLRQELEQVASRLWQEAGLAPNPLKAKVSDVLNTKGRTNATGGLPTSRGRASKKLNQELSTLTFNRYHDKIPLKQIFDAAERNGYSPVDEDGSPWEGILTGAEGRTIIDLKNKATGKVDNGISMSWYKMPSGRYEINAYATGGRVQKFNPYHDERGRFTSRGRGGQAGRTNPSGWSVSASGVEQMGADEVESVVASALQSFGFAKTGRHSTSFHERIWFSTPKSGVSLDTVFDSLKEYLPKGQRKVLSKDKDTIVGDGFEVKARGRGATGVTEFILSAEKRSAFDGLRV